MAYTLGDIGNVPGQAFDFLKRQAGRFVNLTKPGADDDDYTTRSAAIARQRKLADMLSQMGEQEQAVSTAGGITAPMSGMGALARGLTSFGGAYLSGKASADEAAATKAEKAAIQSGLADIFKRSDLVEQGAQQPDDAEGIPQYAANTQVGGGKYILTPKDQQRRLIELVGEHPGAAGQANLYSNLIGDEIKRAEDLSDANIENQRKIDAAALVQEGLNRRYTSPTPTDNRTTYEKILAARNNSQPGSKEYDEYQKQLDKLNYIQQSLNGANIPSGYRLNERGGLEPIPGGPGDLRNTAQGFGQENALRDEYQRGARLFDVTNDAYSKISSVPESPAGDLSMLYNYMKMLDPNSVVRESEFRVAGTARPLLENLGLSWDRINSVWAGNRMTTGQRSDFLKSAKDVYNSALNNQIQRDTQYTDLANSYNLNSDRVVTGSARYKEDPIANGRAAIAAGADRNAVIKRLKDAGIDTKGF